MLAFVQLAALGTTDTRGSWVNGLHGLLALVIMPTALAYAQWSARRLAARAAEAGSREEQSAPVLSPPG